jgi:hypothetical protein
MELIFLVLQEDHWEERSYSKVISAHRREQTANAKRDEDRLYRSLQQIELED